MLRRRGFAISARVSRERGLSSGGMSGGFWKFCVDADRPSAPPRGIPINTIARIYSRANGGLGSLSDIRHAATPPRARVIKRKLFPRVSRYGYSVARS
jgi:hypothetical protein